MDENATRNRRYPRISKELPVQMTSIDAERDPRTGEPCFRNIRERTANLSRGGVFVRTRDGLTPGNRVLVQFHVPGRGEVEAIGRVAWSRSALTGAARNDEGVGISFDGDVLERLLDDDEAGSE